MTTVPKVVSLLAISAALTLSSSHVFAKTVGPDQVKTSGTSAVPSGAGSKYICCLSPPPRRQLLPSSRTHPASLPRTT